MTKQTVGFNWGAAGTSCSVWKGVPLRYILEKAGIKTDKEVRFDSFPLYDAPWHARKRHADLTVCFYWWLLIQGAKHVCFLGADKLPNGFYGTVRRRASQACGCNQDRVHVHES